MASTSSSIDAQDSGMHMPDHIGGGASHHHIFQSGTPYRCHDQQVVIFFVCKVVDRFVRRVLGDEDAGTGILVGKLVEIIISNVIKKLLPDLFEEELLCVF